MRSKLGMMTLAAGLLAAVAVHAATPAEDAAQAARQWVKAVMERDVDTQMKMLPKKLFVKPETMERERRNRMHEKEMALINGEKWVSFDVQPAGQVGKVGNLVMVVLPYRSVVQIRDGRLQRESSLVAVAEEGSSDWSVIDGSGQNPRSIRIFVPGYAGAPAVPPAVTKLLKE